MTLAATQDADMVRILTDAAQVFTFSGTDYACIASTQLRRKELQDGGFMDLPALTIVTRTALFATLPALGQTITFDSISYRIIETQKSQTGKILNLLCESTTK